MGRIDDILIQCYKKISIKSKAAFAGVILAGLIAHIYMFMNKLPNLDDLVGLDSFGVTFKIGRWFLWVLGAICYHLDFVFSLPWINGLITLVFLGVSAGLMADMLNIKSVFANILVGASMIVFPSWTATFFFMFTAPYYAFSVLLAVLSVWCVYNLGKLGFFISMVLLAFSIGIYQAYLPFTATLYVVLLMIMIYEDKDYLAIVKKAFYYLGALVSGGIVYFICMKLSLAITGQELRSYKGVNAMGSFDISRLPEVFRTIVDNFFGVFLNNNLEISYNLVTKVMYAVLFGVSLLLFINLVVRLARKKEYLKVIAAVVLLMAYILAINSIYIMCAEGIYALMYFSYVFMLIVPLVLIDRTFKVYHEDIKVLKKLNIVELVTSLMLVLGIASYCHYANAQYLAIDLSFEQATSYFTTMITQIKSVEGYSDEYPVAFVGFEIDDKMLYQNDVMDVFQLSGRDKTLVEAYSRTDLLRYYCGFQPEYVSIQELPQDIIEGMPVYPESGSIQIVDNIIVVKLSEDYWEINN